MITVCTGFHPQGYLDYGKKCLETFHKYWPESVNLLAYTEEYIDMPRGGCVSVWHCFGAKEFYERHKDVPERCGTKEVHGWREKDKNAGYSFRHDAVKFFKQCFIPEHVALSLKDGEILVWMDGDVLSVKEVSTSRIEGELNTADLIYLERRGRHPDIGFWAVKLNPATREFLADLAHTYRSDRVFKLEQWHSAFVFQECLTRFKGVAKTCTSYEIPKCWSDCPIGGSTIHLKGKLKYAA